MATSNAKPRRYTLQRRAEKQDRTRDRIVRAVMELHEELGPAETTISAVAQRAGVQRLTVYRHFPTETELFQACTTAWLDLNPPPDPEALRSESALERTREALTSLYRYYRATEPMWTAAYRDVERVPALHAPMEAFSDYLRMISRDLLKRFGAAGGRRSTLAATLHHAVQFSTWKSLTTQRLSDAAMAKLVTGWVQASREPAGSAGRRKQRA